MSTDFLKNGLFKENCFFDDFDNIIGININTNNEIELIYKNRNGISKMRIIPRDCFQILKNDEAIIIKTKCN